MNLLDFTTKAGWPGSASTFEFIQGQILLLQQLSLVNGQHYIISGCVVTGSNVSDGKVVVNGEILDFVGGAIQTNVVVVDTVTSKQYFDAQIRPYYHTRYATFGTASTQYAWADFERSSPANGILKRMKAAEEVIATLGTDLDSLTTAFSSHTHAWADITGKPNALISYAGSVSVGDVVDDKTQTIAIPNQGGTNYIVAGSLAGLQVDLNYDNDVMWVIGNKAADQFQLSIREISPNAQNLKFEFVIIKLT